MSEVEITHVGYSPNQTVTIYSISIEDVVNKMVIPIIFGKTSGDRTTKTTWRVIDLNRNERLITVTGKIDSLSAYYNLKAIRARGGTARFVFSSSINANDSDWDSTRSCLNLCITTCTITETAQDKATDSTSPIFDVVLTGRVATVDEG